MNKLNLYKRKEKKIYQNKEDKSYKIQTSQEIQLINLIWVY